METHALEFDLLPLLQKHRFFQWKIYSQGIFRDLNAVDEAIYDIVLRRLNEFTPDNRYSQLWQNLLYFLAVEKHPAIAQLRNKLDESDKNYPVASPDRKVSASELLREQALLMKADVLELMSLRNEQAVNWGFDDYPHLCLNLNEVTLSDMKQMVSVHIQHAKQHVQSILKTHSLSWHTWFTDLHQPSDTFGPREQWIENILRPFGFEGLKDQLNIIESESGLSGCCISWGQGIGLLYRPVNSAYRLRILAHELGHALNAASNSEGGIYAEMTPFYDEALAVVFEYLFIRQYPDEGIRNQMEELFELEYFRCACSALFEFDLWDNPENAEDLYLCHYQKTGLHITRPELWTLDSFRSIDPMTMYAYVIGVMLGKIVEGRCKKQYGMNTIKWGQWYVENILIDGMKRPLFNKLLG